MRAQGNCVWLVCMSCAAICACSEPKEEQGLSNEIMHGTINGSPWVAGSAAVVPADAGVVIEVFESTQTQSACTIDPSTGRRVFMHLPAVAMQTYKASDDSRVWIEVWDGNKGSIDYQNSKVEITSTTVGGSVAGRALYGSSAKADLIEGAFNATLCSAIP